MSMEHSDVIMLERSMVDGDSPKPAVDRAILYVNDSNAQAYNGQIIIDSTQLSTSMRWVDYSEAVIEVPLVLSLKSSIDISSTANSFMATLKAGSWNLIESLQVEFSNRNVQQSVSFSNFAYNYRVLSQWSQDDMEKYGDLCNFWLDSEASSRLATAASPTGRGICNNVGFVTAPSFAATAPLQSLNEGFKRRLEQTGLRAAGNGSISRVEGDFANSGVSYWVGDSGSGAAKCYNTFIICTIRLKDVSDLFSKMPLTKGLQARFTLRYNSARVTITGTSSGTTLVQASVTQLSGNTCPFMVSSAEATTGPLNTTIALGNQTITVENGVYRTSLTSVAHPALTSARLYVPSYILNADAEREYVTSDPVKTIQYEDVFQFIIPNIAAGGQINSLVSNGIVNPTKLVMIPYLQPADARTGGASIEQYQSVFDSAPVTAAPGVTIDQLQVQVAGKSIYDNAISYNWEQFLYEVSKSGVDGGVTTGVSSGLFSKLGYDNNYPYIVVDLSRRYAQQDILPKSIQVTGKLTNAYPCSLLVFVFYKRTIQIEVASGRIL